MHRDPAAARFAAPMTTGGLLLTLALALLPQPAHAFCGIFVARADGKLYNQSSRVALVRDGDRTVITMANDYQGDLEEFAMVIPVPTFIEREQIHVSDPALIDHLDAYSAPRLVEYYDEDPCLYAMREEAMKMSSRDMAAAPAQAAVERARALGVSVEASYRVGEYEILILSAKDSDGLETWLTENGYRIPPGASRVIQSYLKQKMHFFVARVNLQEQSATGFAGLRPLAIAYESPKFMLPIRLGMANAKGPQELLIYCLTSNGRVETTNYRTVRLPTGNEVPTYIKDDFGKFYKAMFAEQVRREGMRSVFLEYAWDMGWCDPCAADPLTPNELTELGVSWLDGGVGGARGGANTPGIWPRPPRPVPGGAAPVFITRLHVRYDRAHFPEDLIFQETGDRENFQGRYVIRHPWTGGGNCPAIEAYRTQLRDRQEQEAANLAELTGWTLADIRRQIPVADGPVTDPKWWRRIWGGK
jgi:hypothetical protein